MERIKAEEGVEEEDDEVEVFPFLPKDWRDSCLVMASITVAGTFTGNKKIVFCYAGLLWFPIIYDHLTILGPLIS